MTETANWLSAFNSRADLEPFGDNALGLFGLALFFSVDDLVGVAANAITDGADDKKCDIVYVNTDDGYAVIAQCYFCTTGRKSAAPANKASDLNTATAWLLQSDIDNLPDRLQSAAAELREGISSGDINRIHIWYVHNLPESNNVESELVTVRTSTESSLSALYPQQTVSVHSAEVGSQTLEEWYLETQSPILVTEEIEIDIPGGYEVSGPTWQAVNTTVRGEFLADLYRREGTRLLSANVRDYLGSRKSDANINNGIKETAAEQPNDFWAFNNGVTALVNDFKWTDSKLTITGISIVNGAQTTGALGSIIGGVSENLQVPIRFVKSNDPETVFGIIQFNNSQNKITASDFRSSDRTQKRLRDQFDSVPDAEYQGGRRGGAGDAIRRNPNLISSYTAGQALAAFHGEPVTAYNKKSEIWVSDRLYSLFFNDDTTAKHMVFVYSLLRAVEEIKTELQSIRRSGQEMTQAQTNRLDFMEKRGANYLMCNAISQCLEIIIGKPIPNRFRLEFVSNLSPDSAKAAWRPILDVAFSFTPQLSPAFSDGRIKNRENISEAISPFRSLMEAASESNLERFKTFSKRVKSC